VKTLGISGRGKGFRAFSLRKTAAGYSLGVYEEEILKGQTKPVLTRGGDEGERHWKTRGSENPLGGGRTAMTAGSKS